MTPASSPFWLITGAAALILFFASVVPAALFVRQRRIGYGLACLPLMAVSYWIDQCVASIVNENSGSEGARAVAAWAARLPLAVFPAALLLILLGVLAALQAVDRYERRQITSMSIKEAVDRLPAGVLMYLPGGQVILVNRAMERCCRRMAGRALINGEQFRDQLLTGDLLPGCRRVMAGRNTPVIVLPDGTAFSLSETDAPYQRTRVHRLLLSDVTETYHKTLSLQKMQADLTALNGRLTAYNREIVALTAEKELLDARVRLHDQMGEDLLTMKRFIRQGGGEEARRDIEAMLRRNITFLKTGHTTQQRDEYTLMLETAEKLGVRILLSGELPATEPQKHVIATALHECITNTLRHARGDELRVSIEEKDGVIRAAFTSNGEQPAEKVQEKGGLSSLRILARNAGGDIALSASPVFSVILLLPKEVPHALQSADRG